MAADKQNPGFSAAVGKVIDDLRGTFKLGIGGTLLYLFLRDPAARGIIARAKDLGQELLKRAGIEAEPFVEDVEGWFRQRINAVRGAFVHAMLLMFGVTIAYLVMVAFVPSFEIKALLGALYLGTVLLVVHDLWTQTWTLTLALGVPAGLITQAQAMEWTKFGSIIAFMTGGAKEIALTGLAWVGNFWKWIAAISIWVAVGVIYTVTLPLFQIPGMIPFGLLFLPLFVFIPLVWKWDERGDQYTWLLWAGVSTLVIVGLLVSFKSQLWFPLTEVTHPYHTWAKVAMWAVAVYVAMKCVRLVQKGNRERQTVATRGRLPRDEYRPPTNNSSLIWPIVVVGIFAILIFKYGFADKINPVMSKNVFPAVNSAVGGQLLPTGPDVEDDYVRNPMAPLSIRSLPNGWTEAVIPAGLGNFQLPVMVQAGHGLEYRIVDSTCTVDFGPRHADLFPGPVEITTSGLINGRRYTHNSFRWLSTYIIKGDQPVGVLMMRAGRSGIPFNIGKQPNGIYQTANPVAREVFLVANLFQLRDEPGYQISGTYTLHYRIVPRPA